MSRLFRYSKPDKIWLILGSTAAVLNGTLLPIRAYIMAQLVVLLLMPFVPDYREKTDYYCLGLFFAGLGVLVFASLQHYFLTIVAENLTLRMRKEAYSKMLKMSGSWFDKPENNPGSLVSKLASDASIMN